MALAMVRRQTGANAQTADNNTKAGQGTSASWMALQTCEAIVV